MLQKSMKLFACIGSAAAMLVGATSARAVIVSGANGTGTANVLPTNPPPVAGWANAGTILGFGGVYLGNGWGLTAAHIAANSTINAGTVFTLTNGQTFTVDQTSTQLHNADNSATDLLLFHLGTIPSLPNVILASSSPALGTSIVGMGNGQTRSANQQQYLVTGSGSGTTWTPVASGGNATGFTESGPQVYRWGTNVTTTLGGGSTATTVITVSGVGNLTVFGSTFDSSGTSSEDQLSLGDSGGPVFDSTNTLIGINTAEFTFTNQPSGTAVFGDQSGYADLATYRGQIASVTGVPEPTAIGVMGLVTVGLLGRRRRNA